MIKEKLFVVEVAPLIGSKLREPFLSYLSSHELPLGSLVKIPLRKKSKSAFVFSSRSVRELKAQLKKMGFALKFIQGVLSPHRVYTQQFSSFIQEVSEYFFGHPGAVLHAIVSKNLFKEEHINIGIQSGIADTTNNVLWMSFEKRIQFYKKELTHIITKKHSAVIVSPTIAHAKRVYKDLANVFPKNTIYWHSNLGKIEAEKLVWRIMHEPVVVIGVRQLVSLPFQKLDTVFIEQEESPHYKLSNFPYIDIRKMWEIASRHFGFKLTYASHFPRFETIWKYDLSVKHSFKKQIRVLSTGTPLKDIVKRQARTLIYINRRGATPVVICQDCSRAQLCKNCSVPLTMHDKQFVCHHCGVMTDFSDACSYCDSWRLKQYGIGIQKIENELKMDFPKLSSALPNTKIIRLDSDTASTKRKAQQIYDSFLAEKSAVLIATNLVFSACPEILEGFDQVIFLFPESVLNLPEFSSGERLLHLIGSLEALSRNPLLVQTRIPQHPLIQNILKSNIKDYIREDLKLRKVLGYPPFKKLIKITIQERKEESLLSMKKKLEKNLFSLNSDFTSYPAFISKVKSVYRWHILLKFDPQNPPEDLKEFLQQLPLSIKIEVDPNTLL